MKILIILGLLCWIALFIFGMCACFGLVTLNPVLYVCACIVCILEYLEKLIWE